MSTEKLRELITAPDGRLSTADAFLYFGAGTVFTLWLVAGALMFMSLIEWKDWEGWFDWGKNFLFASLVPFIIKRWTYRADS